jgi:hypothetical protein
MTGAGPPPEDGGGALDFLFEQETKHNNAKAATRMDLLLMERENKPYP